MKAGPLNLEIEQGAPFYKHLTWLDSSKKPVVLTGFTALMQVRDKADSPVLLELSTENGGIKITNPGVIELKLTSAQTAALSFVSAAYDLKLIVGTEEPRLLKGRVFVEQAITKRGA